MKLFTEIAIQPVSQGINYHDKILAFGSCFAENIGKKLISSQFDIDVNPFGILYNPFSISSSVNMLIGRKLFTKDDLFQYNGLWSSFAHHGHFSTINQDLTLNHINTRFKAAVSRLETCNYLFITFGTSCVYELTSNKQIVANCHKIPENKFTHRQLSVEEITVEWKKLIDKLRTFNSNIKIIFTLSPVRHLKDGAHQNQLSKATLLMSINELQKNENVFYFPAYELMMDELRDYRFYASDMLHPSELAVEYIWQKFVSIWFGEQTQKTMIEIEQINKSIQHKPLHPDSNEYLKFKTKTIEQINRLKLRYPHMSFQPFFV